MAATGWMHAGDDEALMIDIVAHFASAWPNMSDTIFHGELRPSRLEIDGYFIFKAYLAIAARLD